METSNSRSLFSTWTLQESYNHPLGSVSRRPGVEAGKQSQTACYHARHIFLVSLRCGKTRLALDRKIRLPLGTVLKFGSKKHFVGRVVGAGAMVVLVVLPVLEQWLCCWSGAVVVLIMLPVLEQWLYSWGCCNGCVGYVAGAGAAVLLGLVQWLCWLRCRCLGYRGWYSGFLLVLPVLELWLCCW